MTDLSEEERQQNRLPESGMLRARSVLKAADSVVFFTGAGMSADSGVPTFRGSGGLWRGFRPEDLATPDAFESSPDLVRSWYQWRRELISNVTPHAGHQALAQWCLKSRSENRVITQNVDGLHQRAGCPDVIELHGSILHDRCHQCCQVSSDLNQITCGCGGNFRPAVVWFGEALPESEVTRSLELVDSCGAMVVVGTSAVVYPAAGLVTQALQRGVPVIEVNPDPVLPAPVLRLTGSASAVLPRLLAAPTGEDQQ